MLSEAETDFADSVEVVESRFVELSRLRQAMSSYDGSGSANYAPLGWVGQVLVCLIG